MGQLDEHIFADGTSRYEIRWIAISTFGGDT